jgi:hypothetical protein
MADNHALLERDLFLHLSNPQTIPPKQRNPVHHATYWEGNGEAVGSIRKLPLTYLVCGLCVYP